MQGFAQLALSGNGRAWIAVARVGLGVGIEFAQLASVIGRFLGRHGGQTQRASSPVGCWRHRLPHLLSIAERIAATDPRLTARQCS